MGCRLAVLGAGERGGLANVGGCWTEAASGQMGGQTGGFPCPVEERRACVSPFARRITSFPSMEECTWMEGRAQRGTAGRETHQGQREGGKRGRLEGEKAQQACQKPAIQVGLGTSCLPPSSPSACCLPAARESLGPGGAGSCPVVAKGQGRRTTFLLPAPRSIVLQAGSKGMLFSHIPSSFTSTHHP